MQKKTRSILEELDTLYAERDTRHVIENRANNVIASAIRLLEQIEESYSTEQAENLTRKLLNAIKLKDPGKFTRTVRKSDANPRNNETPEA
jgi:FPC/CPF motif-containing protein YcgG